MSDPPPKPRKPEGLDEPEPADPYPHDPQPVKERTEGGDEDARS